MAQIVQQQHLQIEVDEGYPTYSTLDSFDSRASSDSLSTLASLGDGRRDSDQAPLQAPPQAPTPPPPPPQSTTPAPLSNTGPLSPPPNKPLPLEPMPTKATITTVSELPPPQLEVTQHSCFDDEKIFIPQMDHFDDEKIFVSATGANHPRSSVRMSRASVNEKIFVPPSNRDSTMEKIVVLPSSPTNSMMEKQVVPTGPVLTATGGIASSVQPSRSTTPSNRPINRRDSSVEKVFIAGGETKQPGVPALPDGVYQASMVRMPSVKANKRASRIVTKSPNGSATTKSESRNSTRDGSRWGSPNSGEETDNSSPGSSPPLPASVPTHKFSNKSLKNTSLAAKHGPPPPTPKSPQPFMVDSTPIPVTTESQDTKSIKSVIPEDDGDDKPPPVPEKPPSIMGIDRSTTSTPAISPRSAMFDIGRASIVSPLADKGRSYSYGPMSRQSSLSSIGKPNIRRAQTMSPALATHSETYHEDGNVLNTDLVEGQRLAAEMLKEMQRSNERDLSALWMLSENASPQTLLNPPNKFTMNMYRTVRGSAPGQPRNSVPEHFIFGPGSKAGFYTLTAQPLSPFDNCNNEVILTRKDPISQLIKTVLITEIAHELPPLKGSTVPDTASVMSAATNGANDTLIALLHPTSAAIASPATQALLADERNHALLDDNVALARKALEQIPVGSQCRLEWDNKLQRYYLFHPGVRSRSGGEIYLVVIDGTVGFDLLGVHGKVRLINVDTSETLASIDFEKGELAINSVAMERIETEWFYDVVVATLLIVCVVEGRRNREFYPNPVEIMLAKRASNHHRSSSQSTRRTTYTVGPNNYATSTYTTNSIIPPIPAPPNAYLSGFSTPAPAHGRSRSIAARSVAPSVAPSMAPSYQAPSLAPTAKTRHSTRTFAHAPSINTDISGLPTHYTRSTRTTRTATTYGPPEPKPKKPFFKTLGHGLGKAIKGVGFLGYFVVKLLYEMVKAIVCACRPIPQDEDGRRPGDGKDKGKGKDVRMDDLKKRKKEADKKKKEEDARAKKVEEELKKREKKDRKGKGKAKEVDLEAGQGELVNVYEREVVIPQRDIHEDTVELPVDEGLGRTELDASVRVRA